MPSFDIVSRTDMEAVKNAIDGVLREIKTRYDFKGSKCNIEQNAEEFEILAESEQKRKQIIDLISTHITRKKIDPKALEFKKIEAASGNMLKQNLSIKQGIEKDIAQKIVKEIKNSKIKVQVAVQGSELRVTGKKRDELQSIIQLVGTISFPIPLNFVNFRD